MAGIQLSQEVISEIRSLRESGMTKKGIMKKLGCSWLTVQKVTSSSRYDPYVDRIAVGRAMLGDGQVYSAFTDFERREFWMELARISRKAEEGQWRRYAEYLRGMIGVEDIWGNLERYG